MELWIHVLHLLIITTLHHKRHPYFYWASRKLQTECLMDYGLQNVDMNCSFHCSFLSVCPIFCRECDNSLALGALILDEILVNAELENYHTPCRISGALVLCHFKGEISLFSKWQMGSLHWIISYIILPQWQILWNCCQKWKFHVI